MDKETHTIDTLIQLLTERLEERRAIKLYTVDEVAELLSLTSRTIYKYISDKELPACKFGTALRVTHEDLQAFIESKRDND